MEEWGAIEVAVGAGIGAVSIRLIIFSVVQGVKDLFPQLHDQAAVRIVYGVSAVFSTLTLMAVGTYTDTTLRSSQTIAGLILGWFVFTVYFAESAMGQYARLFKVSVHNVPPPVDAQVPMSALDHASVSSRDEDEPDVNVTPIPVTS